MTITPKMLALEALRLGTENPDFVYDPPPYPTYDDEVHAHWEWADTDGNTCRYLAPTNPEHLCTLEDVSADEVPLNLDTCTTGSCLFGQGALNVGVDKRTLWDAEEKGVTDLLGLAYRPQSEWSPEDRLWGYLGEAAQSMQDNKLRWGTAVKPIRLALTMQMNGRLGYDALVHFDLRVPPYVAEFDRHRILFSDDWVRAFDQYAVREGSEVFLRRRFDDGVAEIHKVGDRQFVLRIPGMQDRPLGDPLSTNGAAVRAIGRMARVSSALALAAEFGMQDSVPL